MRTALAAALLLAMPATASAKPLVCVLWPKTCEVPAVTAPAHPEPPLSQPAPIHAAPRPPPPPPPVLHAPRPKPAAAKPRARIKSNFKKPKPKRTAVALPWWCARIPAGTTMDRVDGAASLFIGRPLSATERRQAETCLASKR